MKRTYLYLFFSFISVQICHSCLNFSNYNVIFNATNFEYMLHWSKHDLPADVSFNVQYKRYGQKKWLLFHNCQNITRVYCNLTNAIVGDVEDFMKNQYFARVKTLSTNCTYDWVISKRLNPRDDTYLILPKLSYIQHVHSIRILVPTLSIPVRGKDKQPVTLEDLYKDDNFEYHLNFFNPKKQDIWQKTQTDRTFEVSGLSPDTEYHGHIYISIGNERKSAVQSFVMRTLPDYPLATLIASLIAVFVIVLVAGLLFLSCKYIKQQAQTPNSLVFKRSPTLPLMIFPKDQLISFCTVECYPAIFMQNYDQKQQKTSRSTWQEITTSSQFYASQSNGAITSSQDSAVDTKESYCPQNISSSLSLVHYGKLFVRTSHNVTYLQNTPPNPSGRDSYDSEGDFQINTKPFADCDGDVSNGFIDIPFKFSLFSPSLNADSNTVFNSIAPMGLISSVTVKYDSDFTTQMGQAEEHAPILLSDSNFDEFTSSQMEEYNLQCSSSGHGGNSYILQPPVENVTKDTLDSIIQYKRQCIL